MSKDKRTCMELICVCMYFYQCACYINVWLCMLMWKGNVGVSVVH